MKTKTGLKTTPRTVFAVRAATAHTASFADRSRCLTSIRTKTLNEKISTIRRQLTLQVTTLVLPARKEKQSGTKNNFNVKNNRKRTVPRKTLPLVASPVVLQPPLLRCSEIKVPTLILALIVKVTTKPRIGNVKDMVASVPLLTRVIKTSLMIPHKVRISTETTTGMDTETSSPPMGTIFTPPLVTVGRPPRRTPPLPLKKRSCSPDGLFPRSHNPPPISTAYSFSGQVT